MHIYTLMHLFMEDSGESTDQMQCHDEIALVSHNTAIATRGDSIYIRNFCSLTANIRASRVYRMRGELSVGVAPLRLLFAFEKVPPCGFPTTL